jgi:hypothetical protein
MKFGTGQRSSIDAAFKRAIPGPGEYKTNIENVAKSAPKFGFGTGSRQNSDERLKKLIPGPGAYD